MALEVLITIPLEGWAVRGAAATTGGAAWTGGAWTTGAGARAGAGAWAVGGGEVEQPATNAAAPTTKGARGRRNGRYFMLTPPKANQTPASPRCWLARSMMTCLAQPTACFRGVAQ